MNITSSPALNLAGKENGGNALVGNRNALTQQWLEKKLGNKTAGAPRAESTKKAPADNNAKRAKQSRQQYERELRACRTKQEAEAVRMRWHQMISMEMRAIDQSGMDPQQKAQAHAAAASRLAAVESAHQQFRESGDFQNLPDDDKDGGSQQRVGGDDGKKQGINARPSSKTRDGKSTERADAENANVSSAPTVRPNTPAQAANAPPAPVQGTRPVSSGSGQKVDVYA